jgi:hypothetical protein
MTKSKSVAGAQTPNIKTARRRPCCGDMSNQFDPVKMILGLVEMLSDLTNVDAVYLHSVIDEAVEAAAAEEAEAQQQQLRWEEPEGSAS